ncbi:aldo/keto reductase [bacterium]
MEYRTLGRTKIKVSAVSLGCWTLGGPSWENGYASGWADVDIDEAKLAVDYAVSKGVNHFDTADCYGNSRSELRLGSILGKKINDVIIASKVGYIKGESIHAYVPKNIKKQCEESLKNLNRDYLDIYYFHHGNFGENDKYLDHALGMMHKLKQQGKIRSIGLSAYTTADFVRLIPKIDPDVVQGRANILDQRFIKKGTIVSQILEKQNIPFIAFSPLCEGILLDKYDPENPPMFPEGDHRKNSQLYTKQSLKEISKKLDKIKQRFGNSRQGLARAAFQFILNHTTTACVIPGFRNKEQVKINITACKKGPPIDHFALKHTYTR